MLQHQMLQQVLNLEALKLVLAQVPKVQRVRCHCLLALQLKVKRAIFHLYRASVLLRPVVISILKQVLLNCQPVALYRFAVVLLPQVAVDRLTLQQETVRRVVPLIFSQVQPKNLHPVPSTLSLVRVHKDQVVVYMLLLVRHRVKMLQTAAALLVLLVPALNKMVEVSNSLPVQEMLWVQEVFV